MAKPTFKYETITPAKAERMIKDHEATGFGQRNIKRFQLDDLVRAIERDEFVTYNGEDLTIGVNGEIIDGQHRLRAVVQTGKSIKVGVHRNIPDPERAMPTTGIGSSRGVSDMLIIDGQRVDTILLSAAAKLLAAYRNRSSNAIIPVMRGRNTTKPEVYGVARGDDNLAECVALTRRYFRQQMFPNLSVIAFCWRIARKLVNPEHADVFFESVGLGENLGARDPRLALRNKLLEIRAATRSNGIRTDTSVVAYHILRCLGAFMRAEKLQRLSLPRGEILEFPKVRRTKVAA